jgi:hypothetical protein
MSVLSALQCIQRAGHHIQLSSQIPLRDTNALLLLCRSSAVRLVTMPGTDGHTTHSKQKQPLIKMPHRSDHKKIMLGLQVTHHPLLSLHSIARKHNGCANANAPPTCTEPEFHIQHTLPFITCRCQCGSRSMGRS